MKSISLFVVCALLVSTAAAQENEKTSPTFRYFGLLQSGGLVGKDDKGTSSSFATVHGIAYGPFRVGAGIGYDGYQRWRTMPLFAYVSYDFARIRENQLFIAGAVGHSQAWYRKQTEWDPQYENDGGRMINPMVGYRLAAGKWSIQLAAGYRWQQVNYDQIMYSEYSGLWDPGRGVEVTEKIGRFSFHIGVGTR